MLTKTKLIINSNTNYINYLRSNSYWYKILNRNPDSINSFIKEVKEKYKLRTSDKLNNIIEKIEMINKFINVLK